MYKFQFILWITQTLAYAKQEAGCEFTGENNACIHEAAEYEVFAFEQAADGSKESSHSINREHPDGCDAGELHLSPAKEMFPIFKDNR